jgi:hypothetical protein
MTMMSLAFDSEFRGAIEKVRLHVHTVLSFFISTMLEVTHLLACCFLVLVLVTRFCNVCLGERS